MFSFRNSNRATRGYEIVPAAVPYTQPAFDSQLDQALASSLQTHASEAERTRRDDAQTEERMRVAQAISLSLHDRAATAARTDEIIDMNLAMARSRVEASAAAARDARARTNAVIDMNLAMARSHVEARQREADFDRRLQAALARSKIED
jgi:hypothetical protein